MDCHAHELARALTLVALKLEPVRSGPRVAIIGAGWAGLACAVESVTHGGHVTLFEMSPHAGGRARDVVGSEPAIDNGQHICIGAYSATLRLLAMLDVAESSAFVRTPLRLVDVHGNGLRMAGGPPTLAFLGAVLGRRGWSWRDRLALLAAAHGWMRNRFRADPKATVAQLTAGLPTIVQRELIEPLCVAALNTSADEASAVVFLRVLHDALLTGRGAADLLLPRIGLSDMLPRPAGVWLRAHGAELRLARRASNIEADGAGWRVNGEAFDRVVVATGAAEAARLIAPHDAAWAGQAKRLAYEPIVTVYAQCTKTSLPEPMLMLHSDARRPAQFVFDRGRLGGPHGLMAFVVSGASAWLERGLDAVTKAVLLQAREALAMYLDPSFQAVRTIVEKRATFRCVPLLERPPMLISAGLVAAGDYVDGPYPATLEGAVRSGFAASRSVSTMP